MTVESGTFISDLNPANPGATDLKSEGDDHLRLLKSTLKATFPNITGALSPTHTAINQHFAALTTDGSGQTGNGGAPVTGYKLANYGSVSSIGGEASASGYGYRILNAAMNGGGHLTARTGIAAGVTLGSDGGPLYLSAGSTVISNAPITATSFNGFLVNGNISQFNNDAGYLTAIGSLPSLMVTGGISAGSALIAPNTGNSALSIIRPAGGGSQATLNLVTASGSTWQIYMQAGSNDLGVFNSAYGGNVMSMAQATGAVTFSNTVNAGTFVGALQGNATTATTAGTASSATTAGTATLANSATTALALTGNANLTSSGGLTIAGAPSRFESSNITIQAGSVSYAGVTHGGSRKPDIAQAFYKCTTATGGFSVGDYVEVQNVTSGGASQLWTSATQVGLTQLTSSALYAKDASSGTPIGATSNFALVFICHWL